MSVVSGCGQCDEWVWNDVVSGCDTGMLSGKKLISKLELTLAAS